METLFYSAGCMGRWFALLEQISSSKAHWNRTVSFCFSKDFPLFDKLKDRFQN